MDEQVDGGLSEWNEMRQQRAARVVRLLRQVQLIIPVPHRIPAFGDPPPNIRYTTLEGNPQSARGV